MIEVMNNRTNDCVYVVIILFFESCFSCDDRFNRFTLALLLNILIHFFFAQYLMFFSSLFFFSSHYYYFFSHSRRLDRSTQLFTQTLITNDKIFRIRKTSLLSLYVFRCGAGAAYGDRPRTPCRLWSQNARNNILPGP